MNLIPTGLGSLLRLLIGVFLLQGVTVLLVYTALHTDWRATWPMFVMLGAAIGVVVALWFNTIVLADRHRAVSRVSERFSKEREKIRVRAEQRRAKDGRTQERLAAKAASRSFTANLKTTVMVGGAIGIGTALMLTQFVTVGLITLSAAGGVALGYGARGRLEKRLTGKRLADEHDSLQAIEAVPVEHEYLPSQKGRKG